MKKLKLYIAANAMLIWLIAIVLLMTASISFGAYTYMKYAKRVVSTVNDYGIPFSSNLLSQTTPSLNDDGTEYYDFTSMLFSFQDSGEVRKITVCNYPQNDISAVNPENINYSMKVKIKKVNADASFSDITDEEFKKLHLIVTFGKINAGEQYNNIQVGSEGCEIEGHLNGKNSIDEDPSGKDNVRDDYILTLKLDDETDYNSYDFSKFIISVSAEPDDTSKTAVSGIILARNFMYTGNKTSRKWTGRFSDDFANGSGKSSREYDGFNYEIKGSGDGEFELKWNKKYVDICPGFTESLDSGQIIQKIYEDEDGTCTLKFKVGGDYNKSSYRLQFYRLVPCPANEKFEKGVLSDGDSVYVESSYTGNE